jgi:hypothetical protein
VVYAIVYPKLNSLVQWKLLKSGGLATGALKALRSLLENIRPTFPDLLATCQSQKLRVCSTEICDAVNHEGIYKR